VQEIEFLQKQNAIRNLHHLNDRHFAKTKAFSGP